MSGFQVDFELGRRSAMGEVEERLQLVNQAIDAGMTFEAEQHLHAGYRALARATLYGDGIVPPIDTELDPALEGSSESWIILILQRMRVGLLRDFELDGWRRFLEAQLAEATA